MKNIRLIPLMRLIFMLIGVGIFILDSMFNFRHYTAGKYWPPFVVLLTASVFMLYVIEYCSSFRQEYKPNKYFIAAMYIWGLMLIFKLIIYILYFAPGHIY